MGINQLILSPELIAVLYPESLVMVAGPVKVKSPRQAKPETDKPVNYPFWGGNLRAICFLVNYPGDEFMPAGQLSFIQKMMAACKCGPDDISIVNTAHHRIDLATLRIQLQPEIIFLWGVTATSVGLGEQVRDFTISNTDGILVVPVSEPDLMGLPEGLELKKSLWACLQKLFNL